MFSQVPMNFVRGVRTGEVLALLRPFVAVVLCVGMAFGQSINQSNWGTVTAPVYNSSESNPNYSSAEILAGPNKFGSYYAGVLPNGKKVTPAGTSIQIGMNPLGVALTPDGKFLVSSNDDEREGGLTSYQSGINLGGYSLTVIDTATFTVVSQFRTSVRFFIGLQITGAQDGPYTVWAAGGPDNDVKVFSLSGAGVLTTGNPASVLIPPTLSSNQGFVSNYIPGPQMASPTPVPSGFSRSGGAKITFPAGLQLSPNGKYLYVACKRRQQCRRHRHHQQGRAEATPGRSVPVWGGRQPDWRPNRSLQLGHHGVQVCQSYL